MQSLQYHKYIKAVGKLTCVVRRCFGKLSDPNRVSTELAMNRPYIIVESSNARAVPMNWDKVDSAISARLEKVGQPLPSAGGTGDGRSTKSDARCVQRLDVLFPERSCFSRCNV